MYCVCVLKTQEFCIVLLKQVIREENKVFKVLFKTEKSSKRIYNKKSSYCYKNQSAPLESVCLSMKCLIKNKFRKNINL